MLAAPSTRIWLLQERVRLLGPSVLLAFVNEAAFVFMLILTPRLPVADGDSPFWRAYLATVLLIASNVCAFAGRLLGLARSQASTGLARPARLVGLSLLGSSLATLYWRRGSAALPFSLRSSEAWPLMLYCATSAVNGYTVVLIANTAQGFCGHSLAAPCPITMQFIWLSLQVGAFATSTACTTFLL